MAGGLLQLVAYGAQDVYLTGNPQITFFKVVYRRHTNFAMESIVQSFNGTADFGRRITCQISRNGDLIHRMWLHVQLRANSSTTVFKTMPALALIKNVELEIGGQRIDKHYAEWMYIWNELSLSYNKRQAYHEMVGLDTTQLTSSYADAAGNLNFYVPLEFWFCRNVGLALPLIALQYHDVKVNIEFDTAAAVVTTGTATVALVNMWVDYIYLDTDERRRFAQMSHEYLIEQLQFTGAEAVTAGPNFQKLNLNHPCKQLIWAIQSSSDAAGSGNNKFAFSDYNLVTGTSGAANKFLNNGYILNTKLLLNGQDRFSEREGLYFSLIQPFQHHENVPYQQGINVYSFALKPEEHQPSGTLNMSRVDTAVLSVTCTSPYLKGTDTAGQIYTFATNYNVLRIMSGMGGMAYAN